MNRKLCVAIGMAAVGWMWSGGYAQALDPAPDLRSSRPSEIAPSSGSGEPVGSGVPGGRVGSGMPAGQTDHGIPSTNNMDIMSKESGRMDMGMPRQGVEKGMQSDAGRGGLLGSGSIGSTSGGGTGSLGAPSGSGTAGMGGSSGGGASGGSGK